MKQQSVGQLVDCCHSVFSPPQMVLRVSIMSTPQMCKPETFWTKMTQHIIISFDEMSQSSRFNSMYTAKWAIPASVSWSASSGWSIILQHNQMVRLPPGRTLFKQVAYLKTQTNTSSQRTSMVGGMTPNQTDWEIIMYDFVFSCDGHSLSAFQALSYHHNWL